MGNKCSGQCHICWVMCLAFPVGTCIFCSRGPGHPDAVAKEVDVDKFSIEDLRKVYGNLSILLEPNVFCDQLHGTYHTDPTPTCTVDLSPSDTFLKFVTGIDTPKHLCTEANGNFVDGKCTLNVARFGDATLDAKQAACLSVGAQWDGGSCNLLH